MIVKFTNREGKQYITEAIRVSFDRERTTATIIAQSSPVEYIAFAEKGFLARSIAG